MLTNMLDRVGTLISRQFLISFFMPVLVFSFLNGLVLAWQVPAFRVWFPAQFEGLRGFYALPVLIGLGVGAYLLSAVNVFLRQVLEGRRLLPKALLKEWILQQRSLQDRMENRVRLAREAFDALEKQKPDWTNLLISAGDAGHANPQQGVTYGDSDVAADKVAHLESMRKKDEILSADEIDQAVSALVSVLEITDRAAATPDGQRLERDYLMLLEISDYAVERARIERNDAANEVESTFSDGILRATRMGNVSAALDCYGDTRYGMNLTFFWSRMQLLIQEKKDVYASLMDAKCQLDFLVVCCWLSMLTSVAWFIGMQWLPFSLLLYLIVLVIAPLSAWFFYLLAVENYVVMSDLIKSIVDLFRFQLLKSLNVPQPSSIRQEREIWAALGNLASGKAGLELSYLRDEKQ